MLQIQPHERVAIVGKTGSGKTYFAKALLSQYPRVIVIDPKGTFNSEGYERWTKKTPKLLADAHKDFHIRIPAITADKPEEAYEEIFQTVYENGVNTLIYIDELYGVISSANGGKWLRALMTRGREFNLSVMVATQRPSRIPLFALSEAEWFFCFRLQLLADRARMSEFMGKTALKIIPDKHGFYVYHSEWDTPKYVKELSVKGTT